MNQINEDLARRAKQNHSHFSYRPGSATREYNQMIDEALVKIEKAKERASDEAKERLDSLYQRYAYKLATWINKKNSNNAGHISAFIAGPANYNMKMHARWEKREKKIWAEYANIKDIDREIRKILNGDKIIKSDDKEAIAKLKEKLAKMEIKHQEYKDYNKKARKEGKEQLPHYVLPYSNQEIRRIKARIKSLEAEANREPVMDKHFDGGYITRILS